MIDEWNEIYGLSNQLEFRYHPSGLILGSVSSEHCTAEFFVHGGHITRFQPRGQSKSVLFVSRESFFSAGKPIRGGIPICFPWFGPHPTDAGKPAHGLARIDTWQILETAWIDEEVLVRLGLNLAPFQLRYEMRFGQSLSIALEVENQGSESHSFEVALHTYFDLSNVHTAVVRGLESIPFLDQLTGQRQPASNEPIRFGRETDRIYQGAVDRIELDDLDGQRTYMIQPIGSASTIVWNPWIAKSQRMPDFGDDEYLQMCCIETANVRENRVTIAAGESKTLGAKFQVISAQ